MSYLDDLATMIKEWDSQVTAPLNGLIWNKSVAPSLHNKDDLKKTIASAIGKERLIAQCMRCKLYLPFDTMSIFTNEFSAEEMAECKDCAHERRREKRHNAFLRNQVKNLSSKKETIL